MARTKDGAFSFSQWRQIDNAISTIRQRALTHVRHGMTGRELFDAFVKEDDKAMLTHVFKICNINVGHQSFMYTSMIKDVEIGMLIADIKATFEIALQQNSKFKFLFPKYMQKAQLHKANPDLEEAFKTIAMINFEWARVRSVLRELHEQCESVAQVKTVCPYIAPLLAAVDDSKEFGERLGAMNDTQKIPALPLELRKHALHIGQTITKGLLIPAVSEAEPDDFTISQKVGVMTKKRWDNTVWDAL